MARARSFGLFILVLCLVACACAHGQVSKEDAENAVKQAQDASSNVITKANKLTADFYQLQKDIGTNKENANAAATEAEKAANGNQEAEAIAHTARTAFNEVNRLSGDASTAEAKFVAAFRGVHSKIEELRKKAADTFGGAGTSTDYTKAKGDADAIKTQWETLDKEIDGAMLHYTDMLNAKNKMPAFVTSAQLAKYHVDAIVALAKINTLLDTAENDVKLTEKKKDEIAATVQEIKSLSDTSPTDVRQHVQDLHSSAQIELTSSLSEVERAKKAKEGILELKTKANDSLTKVKAETNVENAKQEVGVAQMAATNAAEKVEEVKNALKWATTCATNAIDRKNDVVKAINESTKKPDVPQDDNKVNPQDPAKTQQPVQDTTESPAGSEAKQRTINKPDQAGSGGTEPTQPSKSDSGMTVSVSLLLALIACASLH